MMRTAKNLRCQQHLNVLRKDTQENSRACPDQDCYHRHPVAEPLGQKSMEKQTKDLCADATTRQGRLPGRRDLVFPVSTRLLSEGLPESRRPEERRDENLAVRFHDDRQGQD